MEAAIADRTPHQATDEYGVVHKLWPVTDPQAITNASGLMAAKALYIADGHHRYETALNYQKELAEEGDLATDHPANYVSMCCISMNDPGMIVLPTHRLWRGVSEIDSATLIAKLQPVFDCTLAGKGAAEAQAIWQKVMVDDVQGQMGFYCAQDDQWVLASMNAAGAAMMSDRLSDKSEAWRDLGVSILHELVMPELLDYKNIPTPKYVRSIDEVVEGINNGDAAGRDATGQEGIAGRFELVSIVMPATIDHVRLISEAQERMPAKSTYFYPKLLSGLILNPLSR